MPRYDEEEEKADFANYIEPIGVKEVYEVLEVIFKNFRRPLRLKSLKDATRNNRRIDDEDDSYDDVSQKHCLDEKKTNPSLLVQFSNAGEYKFIIHNGGLDEPLVNITQQPVVPSPQQQVMYPQPVVPPLSAMGMMNPIHFEQGQQVLLPASPALPPASPALPPASPGLAQLSAYSSPVQNPLLPEPGLTPVSPAMPPFSDNSSRINPMHRPILAPPPSGVPSPLLDIHSQSPATGQQQYPVNVIGIPDLYRGGRNIHSNGKYGTVLGRPSRRKGDMVLKQNSCIMGLYKTEYTHGRFDFEYRGFKQKGIEIEDHFIQYVKNNQPEYTNYMNNMIVIDVQKVWNDFVHNEDLFKTIRNSRTKQLENRLNYTNVIRDIIGNGFRNPHVSEPEPNFHGNSHDPERLWREVCTKMDAAVSSSYISNNGDVPRLIGKDDAYKYYFCLFFPALFHKEKRWVQFDSYTRMRSHWNKFNSSASALNARLKRNFIDASLYLRGSAPYGDYDDIKTKINAYYNAIQNYVPDADATATATVNATATANKRRMVRMPQNKALHYYRTTKKMVKDGLKGMKNRLTRRSGNARRSGNTRSNGNARNRRTRRSMTNRWKDLRNRVTRKTRPHNKKITGGVVTFV